ncbi:hypothetical protein OQA88_11825 [Cercophora sp. LCS_1]
MSPLNPESTDNAEMEKSKEKRSSRASSLTLASLSNRSLRSSPSISALKKESVARHESAAPAASRLGVRARLNAALRRAICIPVASSSTEVSTGDGSPTPTQKVDLRNLALSIKEGAANGDDVRVLQLKYDAILANAAARPRATEKLFKEACATDLLFLIDTTGSMASHIGAAKKQVKDIVKDIKDAFFSEASVRIAVVGYKDHGDRDNIQFLDFTPSADKVRHFINGLSASGGSDAPEDVLGGLQKALNASWAQQTRCIIHIADAPAHGNTLNDYGAVHDTYSTPGSEPHKLLHGPLLQQMIGLNINYALLQINSSTDRMVYAFLQAYAEVAPESKLLSSNKFSKEAKLLLEASRSRTATKRRAKNLLFEEHRLGTSYDALRHLVVKNITTSVSLTATRLSFDPAGPPMREGSASRRRAKLPFLKSIQEDELDITLAALPEEPESELELDTSPPAWTSPTFLDKTIPTEAFSTDVNPSATLDDMLASDAAIPITATDLTIHTHSLPFAHGALRTASYARTPHSTNPLVVKSFKTGTKHLAHLADDMRVHVLCKAFAQEFNALVSAQNAIDFIVPTILRPKDGGKPLSLEPFIPGVYIKYNSNSGFVNDTSSKPSAQAFSHFTYERSKGRFLVADLQGVGGVLTDPAIHTLDQERFKLCDTNLGGAGFKFFFATHVCNEVCKGLKLKSDAEGLRRGKQEWRVWKGGEVEKRS